MAVRSPRPAESYVDAMTDYHWSAFYQPIHSTRINFVENAVIWLG
jgi:hypothetical protein